MKTRRRISLLIAPIASLAMLNFGCGTGLTLDSTLGDALAVLTSGDLASAFARFASTAEGTSFNGLDDEQLVEIESLQAQLDAGEITEDEFNQGVGDVIGDAAPNLAFAGLHIGGAPFGGPRPGFIANALDLTDEQQEAARAIFESTHEEIAALRSQAKEDIRALLTEEQLATLDELKENRPGPFGGIGPGMGPGRRRPHIGNGSIMDRLIDELELTEDQQMQIAAIRETLRTEVEALHAEAREAFRDLLTDDQLATLDELEASHPHHGPATDGESEDDAA